jgi:hypothetical protein
LPIIAEQSGISTFLPAGGKGGKQTEALLCSTN